MRVRFKAHQLERLQHMIRLLFLWLLGGTISAGSAGCAVDSAPPGPDELRFRFPEQAPRVLDGAEPFVPVSGGFALASTSDPAGDIEASLHRRGGLHAALPARGEGEIRFHLPGGFDVRVREIGAAGEGVIVDNAVAFPREGGTSRSTPPDPGESAGRDSLSFARAAHLPRGLPRTSSPWLETAMPHARDA
ncbi:uncharacterized protein SOCE26_038890 [Sorangium cellulosum]|uniref:Uncharacterized protein n=1 Tax=Sorangium cellulosum TaxID=56 RepID=A0A2L0ET33_SORCE|nr:hypothetical protein [Sorangium cellulosum]AUX42456.1 uncharacterized protein SOCE26_038890 [Sorangium cellulosum]